jgi:hypothetical protein
MDMLHSFSFFTSVIQLDSCKVNILCFLFKKLKNDLWFMFVGAEVAQIGRALDSTIFIVEGEAEDRVVAGSSPALGTIYILWNKLATQ